MEPSSTLWGKARRTTFSRGGKEGGKIGAGRTVGVLHGLRCASEKREKRAEMQERTRDVNASQVVDVLDSGFTHTPSVSAFLAPVAACPCEFRHSSSFCKHNERLHTRACRRDTSDAARDESFRRASRRCGSETLGRETSELCEHIVYLPLGQWLRATGPNGSGRRL